MVHGGYEVGSPGGDGTTARGKGSGPLKIVPAQIIERDHRRRGPTTAKRKGRATAKHLLDLQLEEVTPAAKRIAPGTRLAALGSGPRLVLLSPRGVLGLASLEASEAMRAALATAPGARLESLVTAVTEGGVSVSVALVRAAGVDERATRGGAQPFAKPAAGSVAGTASSSRRGR